MHEGWPRHSAWPNAASPRARFLAQLETPSPAIELEKLAAAREAALLIEPGMVVGLGSGSTVNRLIEVLAEARRGAVFVAASPASERAAAANGLRVLSLDVASRL